MRIRKLDALAAPPAAPPKPSAAERTVPMFAEPPTPQAQPNAPPAVEYPPPIAEGFAGPARHPLPSAHNVATHVAPDDGRVTVTWGEELYQPRQWNSFRVGPFTISAKLMPNETVSQAVERLSSELEQVAARERAKKVKAYFDALDSINRAIASRPG